MPAPLEQGSRDAGLAQTAGTVALAVYVIASTFPGQAIARWLVFMASAAALAANGVILKHIARASGDWLDN